MKIIGTGRAHPAKVVTNAMLEGFLDTSDEWIRTRTGIAERRVISSERLEDLAAEASLKAIEDAGAIFRISLRYRTVFSNEFIERNSVVGHGTSIDIIAVGIR